MTTVKVRVVVLEDDQVVAESELTYYAGQYYVVQIVTPDGVDSSRALKAGVSKVRELRSLTPDDFPGPERGRGDAMLATTAGLVNKDGKLADRAMHVREDALEERKLG